MTVYADNVRIRADVGRLKGRVWCHLLTDDPTLDELHDFAQQIGLHRAWFQPARPTTAWWRGHYDVTEQMRARAIRAGAKEIEYRVWSEMVARFKATTDRDPAAPWDPADDPGARR